MLILGLIIQVFAQEFTEIPITGSPPDKSTAVESIYDPVENQLISFGGLTTRSMHFSTSLSMFSLSSLKWKFPTPQSSVTPPGLTYSKLFLRSDRKLFMFFGSKDSSLSSDIYSYDLTSDSWNLETLQGYKIPACTKHALASFTLNSIQYVALFGGMTKSGASNNLYLINTLTLYASKLPASGNIPPAKLSASLTFYNNSLYLFGQSWNSDNTYDQDLFVYSLTTNSWSVLLGKGSKPDSRSEHFAYVYKECMYIVFGNKMLQGFDQVLRFNFTESSWGIAGTGGYRQSFGAAAAENAIYVIMGRDTVEVYNSIDMFVIDHGNVHRSSLSPNWESPIARKNHCSITISDKIVIFGGESDQGKFLNDLWMYDVTLNYWSSITTTGNVPTPRSSFSCINTLGSSISLFGGRDGSNLYSDFYYFDSQTSQWFEAESSTGNPPARYNSCLCVSNFYFFVLGGQDDSETFSDIWVFNYFAKTCDFVGYLPIKLTNFKCWVDSDSSNIQIYIVGGNTANNVPNNKLFRIELIPSFAGSSEFAMNSSVVFESSYIGLTESPIIIAGNYIFLIFGLYYNTQINNDIISLNYHTNELKSFKFTSNIGLYGHSAAQYKDNFYIFGGVASLNGLKVYNQGGRGFFKIKINGNSSNYVACSSGTYGIDCTPCPTGTYFFDAACVECPAGTYSNIVAANSANQCLPCKFGTFAAESGATRCLDCPYNSFCPIRCTSVIASFEMPSSQNNQPAPYQGNDAIISNAINYSWYAFFAASGLLFILVTISNSLYNSMKGFDIFVESHSQDLDAPVIFRKTSMGGIFSVLFIPAALILIVINIVNFQIDNVTELRSLVPVTTLDQKIKANEFTAEIIYYLFNGKCNLGNNVCTPDIIFSTIGFTYDSNTTTCEMLYDTCTINIQYLGFTLKEDSKISISLANLEFYTIGISVNLTVSSSIPDQVSNVFIPVLPDSFNTLFRGSLPTVFTYEANPTVFTSESNQWIGLDTGYHISQKGIVSKGSTVSPENLYTEVFVLLELQIGVGSTGFMVNRVLNSTFFLSVGTTLGSIFGLLGTFATVMGVIEGFSDKAIERKRKKKFREKVLNGRIKLTHDLEVDDPSHRAFFKIYPSDVTFN